MADYGINRRYTRAKVPLQVLIGFFPTEPVKLSSLAAPEADSGIKSGMAIVREIVSGVPTFRKAEAADATSSLSIYIALTDADAHDVQACGKLVGLDCSDKFVVQTGYFTIAGVWALDDPVTVGADGVFTKAEAGDTVVGYITNVGTNADKSIATGGLTPSASDLNVIEFKTAQSGLVLA